MVKLYLLGTEEAEKSGTGGFPSLDLRADLRGYLSFELIEFPIEKLSTKSKSDQKREMIITEKELKNQTGRFLPEVAELTLFSVDFSIDKLRNS